MIWPIRTIQIEISRRSRDDVGIAETQNERIDNIQSWPFKISEVERKKEIRIQSTDTHAVEIIENNDEPANPPNLTIGKRWLQRILNKSQHLPSTSRSVHAFYRKKFFLTAQRLLKKPAAKVTFSVKTQHVRSNDLVKCLFTHTSKDRNGLS